MLDKNDLVSVEVKDGYMTQPDTGSPTCMSIQLQRAPPHAFRAGETITGTVRLSCERTLRIKILQIELLGRAVVVLPYTRRLEACKGHSKAHRFSSSLNGGFVVTTQSADHTKSFIESKDVMLKAPTSLRKSSLLYLTQNEEVICHQLVNLLCGDETVSAGEYFHHFVFHLPESCASTFTGSRGSVEYSLTACLHLSTGGEIQVMQGITVVRDLVIGKSKDIPCTLSNPPIDRKSINRLSHLSINFNNIQTVPEKHSQEVVGQSNGDENLVIYNVTRECSNIPGPNIVKRTNKDCNEFGVLGKLSPRKQLVGLDMARAERMRNPLGSSDQSAETARNAELNSVFRWLPRICPSRCSSRARTAKVRVSQCMGAQYHFQPTQISGNKLSTLEYQSLTGCGMPGNYAVFCRLTVSQRQVIPGDSVTARLALVVDTPLSLMLLSETHKQLCAYQRCSNSRTDFTNYKTGGWSPLARALASHFIEEDRKQDQQAVNKNSSSRRWTQRMKHQYRIYLVLRQLITYRDRTHHVVAEEEREVYSGEMKRRQSADNHLLRVSLEHSFRVPPVTASGLEGTFCIDVSYNIGVVYFKVKRLTHLWHLNEWQLISDSQNYHQPITRGVELLYFPTSAVPSKPTIRSSKKLINSMWSMKRPAKTESWGRYTPLLLPIPLIIGTSKVSFDSRFVRKAFHLATEMLFPTFYMQSPDSCTKGSLPPVHICYATEQNRASNHSEILDGSATAALYNPYLAQRRFSLRDYSNGDKDESVAVTKKQFIRLAEVEEGLRPELNNVSTFVLRKAYTRQPVERQSVKMRGTLANRIVSRKSVQI